MFGRSSAEATRDPLLEKPASFGIHRYLQGSSNLFEENRLLKFSIAGLFGITVVLGIALYTSSQNQRTIVVPFGAGGDLYVTGRKPSPSSPIRTVPIAARSIASGRRRPPKESTCVGKSIS